MFSLPDFSVKRPVCVFICLASLVIFGVSSVFSMPMESTPEMTSPMFTVMTSYSGASPDEVDEMVTDPDRIGPLQHFGGGVDELHLQRRLFHGNAGIRL